MIFSKSYTSFSLGANIVSQLPSQLRAKGCCHPGRVSWKVVRIVEWPCHSILQLFYCSILLFYSQICQCQWDNIGVENGDTWRQFHCLGFKSVMLHFDSWRAIEMEISAALWTLKASKALEGLECGTVSQMQVII